ncbi:MAG: ribosome silencing factor, partial [Acetobacteraceae bacterium]|nr:ribosome silencing factor [Acetobacteraceae bacterium]
AAGPAAAPPRPRRAKAPPPQLERMVAAPVATQEDDKAEDIVVLDIASRSSFADRMIVASGLSERQLQAMARNLEEALAEAGWARVRIEASPEWVLLDAGDLIIHLFRPATRETYGIERMWGPESPHG